MSETVAEPVVENNEQKVWKTVSNSDNLISDLASEIDKNIESKGNFEENYSHFCKEFGVVPCPYFKSYIVQHGDVKLTNIRITSVNIDISNWRAMLLSCSTKGSTINGIIAHGIQCSPQHIIDLTITLEKSSCLKILKLDFLNFTSSLNDFYEPLNKLLETNASLEYISLKGNKLGDEFIKITQQSIQTNLFLKSLCLSDNLISDVGVSNLFSFLRLNTTLCELSLSKNDSITSSCFKTLAEIISGTEASPEDISYFTNLNKEIGDNNKKIKDENKKRKKAGQTELLEIPLFGERIFKIGTPPVQKVVNTTLKSIDFSYNSNIIANSKDFKHFCNLLGGENGKLVEAAVSTVVSPFTFILRGADASSRLNQSFFDEIIPLSSPYIISMITE
jgi:hypothetical protein